MADESTIKSVRITKLVIDNVYNVNQTNNNGNKYKTEPLEILFGDQKTDTLINEFDKKVLEILYPVGTLYWTSNGSFDPNGKFTGVWARITDTFVYAAGKDDSVKQLTESDITEINKVKYANLTIEGQKTVTLSINNLPAHTHSVIDPGHEHKIRTIGDDYNASKNGGINFAQDGSSDMTNTNYSRGAYAVNTTTGISIASTGSGNAFSIMPPHIKRYCWERVS